MKKTGALLLVAFCAIAASAESFDFKNAEAATETEIVDKSGKPLPGVSINRMLWTGAGKTQATFEISPDGENGAKCLRVSCKDKGVYGVFFQIADPKPGMDCRVSFKAKALLPGSETQFLYEIRGSKHYYKAIDFKLQPEWKVYEATLTTPEQGSAYFRNGAKHTFYFRFWSTLEGSAPCDMLIDEVKFVYDGPSLE